MENRRRDALHASHERNPFVIGRISRTQPPAMSVYHNPQYETNCIVIKRRPAWGYPIERAISHFFIKSINP